MHPSHIQFIGKSESTTRNWSAYGRPSCRLFGDHDCSRTALGDDCIEMAQKANCLQIFAAAVNIGDPFTFFAAVVAVQDRKSTRLNSSHVEISYAVFCLK